MKCSKTHVAAVSNDTWGDCKELKYDFIPFVQDNHMPTHVTMVTLSLRQLLCVLRQVCGSLPTIVTVVVGGGSGAVVVVVVVVEEEEEVVVEVVVEVEEEVGKEF